MNNRSQDNLILMGHQNGQAFFPIPLLVPYLCHPRLRPSRTICIRTEIIPVAPLICKHSSHIRQIVIKQKCLSGLDYNIQKAHRFTDISTHPATYSCTPDACSTLHKRVATAPPKQNNPNSPI